LRNFGFRFFLINYVFLMLYGTELWDECYRPLSLPELGMRETSACDSDLQSEWCELLMVECSASYVGTWRQSRQSQAMLARGKSEEFRIIIISNGSRINLESPIKHFETMIGNVRVIRE